MFGYRARRSAAACLRSGALPPSNWIAGPEGDAELQPPATRKGGPLGGYVERSHRRQLLHRLLLRVPSGAFEPTVAITILDGDPTLRTPLRILVANGRSIRKIPGPAYFNIDPKNIPQKMRLRRLPDVFMGRVLIVEFGKVRILKTPLGTSCETAARADLAAVMGTALTELR